jgi:hypothetical protein
MTTRPAGKESRDKDMEGMRKDVHDNARTDNGDHRGDSVSG